MHRYWNTLSEGDKKAMEELLHANKLFLDKFSELCYTRIKELEKARRKDPDYTDSNWATKQADMNGYIRAMHDMTELLKLDKE